MAYSQIVLDSTTLAYCSILKPMALGISDFRNTEREREKVHSGNFTAIEDGHRNSECSISSLVDLKP